MLSQLTCRSFRNLEDARWQPGPGCHLVLGPNGAGKTSLLEAIYLLATTRSFRTAQVIDCRSHGSRVFHLEGEIESDQRLQLAVGIGRSGRYRTVNGRATSLVEHLRVLPVVAWTAEDAELLAGPPERRRRFLDQGVVGTRPAALETLTRFRRALLQKRQLLLKADSGLASWNEILAEIASELMALRQEYLGKVSLCLQAILESCDLDLPEVSLEYRPSIRGKQEGVDGVLAELERISRQERQEGRPLVGPQRDEVIIRWGGHSVKRVGSAGERKLLGLLLTAARGRVLAGAGRSPIVLLDDADSELDEGRLASVWMVFDGAEQAVVTSSRPALWSRVSETARWGLDAGRIRPL